MLWYNHILAIFYHSQLHWELFFSTKFIFIVNSCYHPLVILLSSLSHLVVISLSSCYYPLVILLLSLSHLDNSIIILLSTHVIFIMYVSCMHPVDLSPPPLPSPAGLPLRSILIKLEEGLGKTLSQASSWSTTTSEDG